MTESTAVAKRPLTAVIAEGAQLDAEAWPAARIGAAMRLLPTKFQDELNCIAFLAIAAQTGLNPLTKEIWAWEQEGRLQFMTARDGWLKLSRQDPGIESLEYGIVYEKDVFRFHAGDVEGIVIEHEGSMDRGEPIGAYCCAHMVKGADHLERRLVSDYAHLIQDTRRKPWQQYMQEMLLTRTISACCKLATRRGGALYTVADFEMAEVEDHGGRLMQAATGAKADALSAALSAEMGGEAPVEGGREIALDAVLVDDDGASEEDAGTLEEPPRFVCDELTVDGTPCGAAFSTQAGLNGHKGVHAKEKRRKQQEALTEGEEQDTTPVEVEGLPEGYLVVKAAVEGMLELWDPDGVYVGQFATPDSALEGALSDANVAHELDLEPVEPLTVQELFTKAKGTPFEKMLAIINQGGYEQFRKAPDTPINVFDLDDAGRGRLYQALQTA